MAVNDVYLFTVGYTSSDIGSVKPNYPIKQIFRQIQNTTSPLFPESYTLESALKFWFPFDDAMVSDQDYIEYQTGDEFTFDGETPSRTIAYADPSITNNRYSDYNSGARLLYANQMYEATDYFFNWLDTGFPVDDNPYSTNRLRIWKLFGSGEDWVEFWYNPKDRRFYPLPNSIIDEGLPLKSDFIDTRWDLFGGDSTDIDMSSLSDRKIDELSSQGFSLVSAQSIVASEERRAIDAFYGSQQISQLAVIGSTTSTAITASTAPDNGLAQRSNTALVTRFSTGSEGEGGGGSSDQPQMVQIYKNPDGTVASSPARFIFDYRPNSVNYSNIGSEWTEIARANNLPLLDFRSYKLLKISFEFLVGDNNNIFTSCDTKLRELRQMATRPFPVTFLGFDAMFTEQITHPQITGGSGIQFAIVDMAITSVQRARASASSEPTGEINRATVSMTIQELPLETYNLIQLPQLNPDPIIKKKKEKEETSFCYKLFTENPGFAANYEGFLKAGGCGSLTYDLPGRVTDRYT